MHSVIAVPLAHEVGREGNESPSRHFNRVSVAECGGCETDRLRDEWLLVQSVSKIHINPTFLYSIA